MSTYLCHIFHYIRDYIIFKDKNDVVQQQHACFKCSAVVKRVISSLTLVLVTQAYDIIAVTSVKHSWKYSLALTKNRSWAVLVQDQCSDHGTEPKSQLADAVSKLESKKVVRDWLYSRSLYAKSMLLGRYVSWEYWSITIPLLKEVIIYDYSKPF